jgi:hypothetical protein
MAGSKPLDHFFGAKADRHDTGNACWRHGPEDMEKIGSLAFIGLGVISEKDPLWH